MADKPSSVHGILVVHGAGEQKTGQTRATFERHFVDALKRMLPRVEIVVEHDNAESATHVTCGSERFVIKEVAWETRLGRPPSIRQVLRWTWRWARLGFSVAWRNFFRGRHAFDRSHRAEVIAFWPGALTWIAVALSPALLLFSLTLLGVWLVADTIRLAFFHPPPTPAGLRHTFLFRFKQAIIATLLLGSVPIVGAIVAVAGRIRRLLGRSAFGPTYRFLRLAIVGFAGDLVGYVFSFKRATGVRAELEGEVKLLVEFERVHDVAIFANSLGTVITFEALAWTLPEAHRRKVRTFASAGTPLDTIRWLRAAYGRANARRFEIDVRQAPADFVWLNFWTVTDPIPAYGPLGIFPWPFEDEALAARPINVAMPPRLLGHESYWRDLDGVYKPFIGQIVAPGSPLAAYAPGGMKNQARIA